MIKFLRTTLFFSILTFASYSYGYANNPEDAKTFVQSTSARVESLLKQRKPSKETENKLNAIFLEVADVDWIGKFVIGKYWQSLDERQKIDYLQNYKKYLLASYVPLFKNYNGQKVAIRGIKKLSDDQYVVVTEIKSADANYDDYDRPNPDSDQQGQSYKVEYRIKYDGGNFKMRDIVAEGVSMLATQRSEFASILNNSGYNALIEKLAEKGNRSSS
jgi:phospholipid transport system substrate-binding protein